MKSNNNSCYNKKMKVHAKEVCKGVKVEVIFIRIKDY